MRWETVSAQKKKRAVTPLEATGQWLGTNLYSSRALHTSSASFETRAEERLKMKSLESASQRAPGRCLIEQEELQLLKFLDPSHLAIFY